MAARIGLGVEEVAGPIPLRVTPRKAIPHHFRIDVAARKEDAANFARIAINVDDLDTNLATKDFRSERLACSGAERLTPLGGVDSGEPDLVLPVRFVEDS
jgi:hypothetical protein